METLFNDPEKLKEAFLSQQADLRKLQEHAEASQAQVAELEHLRKQSQEDRREIERLKEMILLLRRARFGAQSEKLKQDIRQLWIFNEAEVYVGEESEGEDEKKEVRSYRRGKAKRRPLPDYVEREIDIIELPASERKCSEGHDVEEIGEESSERLDVIPMRLVVKETRRKKYACRTCQGEVKEAPVVPSILPKSMAAEGLLAHIAISKYGDGLPLYRQAAMFERLDIDLDRTTMARWMIGVGRAVEPLLNLMREDLAVSRYLQCDESPLQVLKEPGRRATTSSYMWVLARASPEEKPIVVYEYDPRRSGDVPLRLLEDFAGFLQVDGYDAYNPVCAQKGVIRVGCMAHARRKFYEASKVSQKKGVAKSFLGLIQKLYLIERSHEGRSAQERYEGRQREAKPILDKIYAELEEYRSKVPPKATLGKAIAYAWNEWPYLTRYLDDGSLRIDNNFVENKIRPFALGRKNWLFADTPKGAQASASLYSLIETAKANELNPFRYLHHVFLELPKAKTLEQVEALLPYKVKL